jgi:ribonuclease HI
MGMALLPKVLVYADGASRGNPGPAALGIVICDAFENVLTKHRQTIGRATNNEAEYRALIRALELAAQHTRAQVEVYMDSQLVINQLNGTYRVKEPRLAKLVAKVNEKAGRFEAVTYEQVPRGHRKIKLADTEANLALDERYGR